MPWALLHRVSVGSVMSSWNPFRVTFDHPLEPRGRIRVRISALLVAGALIVIGTSGLVTILNSASEMLGSLANGEAEPQTQRAASESEGASGIPCAQQTWPNIEARCLSGADGVKKSRSVTIQRPKPQQQASTPTAPEVAALAAAEPGTTGAATKDQSSTNSVPLPVPAPARGAMAAVPAPAPESQTDQAAEPLKAQPEPSRIQRAPQRQAQQRQQKQKRARSEARNNARGESEREQLLRRFPEYTIASPGYHDGGTIIRRDLRDDSFFFPFR
jgi:hypothetical protein